MHRVFSVAVNHTARAIKPVGRCLVSLWRSLGRKLSIAVIKWVAQVAVVIVGSLLVIWWTTIPTSCKQEELDFRNRLQAYDKDLMRGFVELQADFARRGVYQSGFAVQQAIQYFQDFRRDRDHLINEYLLECLKGGCDTSHLVLNKKLQVNVAAIIDSHWGQLGMDNKASRLDTL